MDGYRAHNRCNPAEIGQMIHIVFIVLGTKYSSGEMNYAQVDKETYKNILFTVNGDTITQSPGERDTNPRK